MNIQERLKVRGRSTGDMGTWITGYYHYDRQLNEHYICEENSLYRFEVDPATVGQLMCFIGGIEYFEDDIVGDTMGVSKRIWIDPQYGYVQGDIEKMWDEPFYPNNFVKVIGNIHQNA